MRYVFNARAGSVLALLLALALSAGLHAAAIELTLFAVTDTHNGTPNTPTPGTPRGVFGIGETVRITFRLANTGASADVDVVCQLRDHAAGLSYVCYDTDNPRKTASGAVETRRFAGLGQGAVHFVSFDCPLPRWGCAGSWDVGGFARDAANPAVVYDTTAAGPATAEWTDMWLRGRLYVVTSASPRNVLSMLYHSVGAGSGPAMFSGHLAALTAYRYSAITPDEFFDHRAGRRELPPRPVMLTFDGGYLTHYENVLPMLQKAGYTGTFFIVTNQINETTRAAKRMIWPEVAALRDQGMVIGSHSVTHSNFEDLDPAAIATELADSKAVIESRLGQECAYFCYPLGSGASDNSVQGLVRDAGYRGAFSITCELENTATCNPVSLKRIQAEGVVWTSIVLDNSAPDMFFMRKIDPSFPIPALHIPAGLPRFRDTAGAYRTEFHPGEAVVAEFQVSNAGDPIGAIASLELDSDTVLSTVAKFDSRASLCDVILPRIGPAAQPLSYEWAIPPKTHAATFYYRLIHRDLYGVLTFHSTGWHPGFDVTVAPVARRLMVQSDPPGATVTVTPLDNGGAGGGETPLQRTYNHGTSVMAVAPGSFQGKVLQRWYLDGTELDPAANPHNVAVIMDADHVLKAVYHATGGDTLAPNLTVRLPAPGAWRARLNDLVRLRLEDACAGVDSTTVRIEARVEDSPWELLSDGLAEYRIPGQNNPDFLGVTRRSGAAARYVYEFQPSLAANIGYARNVQLRVTAQDFAGNVLSTGDADWSFATEPRPFGPNLPTSAGVGKDDFAATAVDADGSIWAAWERTDERGVGAIWVTKRTPSGFQAPWVVPPAGAGDRRRPALAADGGTIYLAWQEKNPVTGLRRIRVFKSGTAVRPYWIDLGDPGFAPALDVRYPRLAVDALGELHLVALAVGPQGTSAVTACRSVTGAWSVVELATRADDAPPQAAFGGDDVLVASWLTDGTVRAAARVSGVWGAPAQLTAGGQAITHTIALERRRGAHPVLHLAWVEGPAPGDLRYAQTDGALLAALASSGSVLDGPPASGMRPAAPAMRLDDAGRDVLVFLAWQDGRMAVNGDRDIFFAEKRGRYPFGVNLRLDDDASAAAQSAPALGVDAFGNPYALWTDARTTPSRIWFTGASTDFAVGKSWRVTAAGGKRAFMQSSSRQLRLMDVRVPPGVFPTARELRVAEALDPAGRPRFLDRLCIELGPSVDEELSDWITLTFYDVSVAPTPLLVYRFVPPAGPLDTGKWTHDFVRGESFDPDARTFSFQVKHLSLYDVGIGLGPAGSGGSAGGGDSGGGGGGCSTSPNRDVDWAMFLPVAAAAALWLLLRVRRRAARLDRLL